jgi:mannosyltransferase
MHTENLTVWLDKVRPLHPAALPALVMLVVGRYHAGNPSLGWDENATVIVARRSLGQIADLIRHTDGSIAPYYLFMHFWVAVFGTSEIALRAPSIIAMAIGVGLVGELGRRLFNPAVGLIAGLLLCAVPLISRYAQDARVYGITFMLVALATLLLYRAVEQPTWRRWCWYGMVVLLVGLAHLIGLTMLAGHAFVVANRWRRDGEPGLRRGLVRWLPVTAVAVVAVVPLAALGLSQRGNQLDWIDPVTFGTVRQAPVAMFGVAGLAWLVIGLALVGRWPDRWLVAELAVMAVVPPAALLAVSFVTDPLWVPRYVLFALAPLALLAAVTMHRNTIRTVAVFALIGALAWSAQIDVRGPATHHGPSFRQVASIISRNQHAGDGIVYGGSSTWSLRAGVDYYLAGKRAPRDVLLARPAAEVGRLGADECPDPAACLTGVERIWLIRLFEQDDPLAAAGRAAPVLRADYRSVKVWQITKGTVALYERKP